MNSHSPVLRPVMAASIAVVLLAVGSPAPGLAAVSGSLPSVSSGPRPGPDILYEPPATAPQLENGPGWEVEPLMVAGAEAHVDGEYLYQDHVYDSYGANTTDTPFAEPDTVPSSDRTGVGAATGDVVYPTDVETYGHDAADLLEFRARLDDEGEVVYRITLNTMLDEDVAGVAVGIDTDRDAATGRTSWGHGIGSLGSLGLEHVLVTWGTGAEISSAGPRVAIPPHAPGGPAEDAPLPRWFRSDAQADASATASVDPRRNQIEVETNLRPGDETWRHYVVIGLFDPEADEFKQVLEEPTETHPGGSHGADPPPVLNVGFRLAVEDDEPVAEGMEACRGNRGLLGCGHWKEHGQALALEARDIRRFGTGIDFDALASGETDRSGVPQTGFLTRLYASHLDLGEGARPTRPMLRGKIQPYGLYVPRSYDPADPPPFHLELHWLQGSWMQFAVLAPNIYRQLGEDRGAIVLTPQGRGPNGWYHDEAEVDLFEAWADAAAHYALDPDRVTISGYSMGGYGTFRTAAMYPDLFARGFPIVGPSDESIFGGATAGVLQGNPALRTVDDVLGFPSWGRLTDEEHVLPVLDNLRHVPMLMWHGSNDINVPVSGALAVQRRLEELGYAHELDVFAGYDHFRFQAEDEWGPGRRWLSGAEVDRNPAHVTYRALPAFDAPELGLVHDHAYWVGDVVVGPGQESGLVDVLSRAAGVGDPRTEGVVGAGTTPAPHLKRGLRSVEPAPSRPAENALDVRLEGVRSVTLWPERGGVDPGEPVVLRAETDRRASITLKGTFCAETVTVRPPSVELVVHLSSPPCP